MLWPLLPDDPNGSRCNAAAADDDDVGVTAPLESLLPSPLLPPPSSSSALAALCMCFANEDLRTSCRLAAAISTAKLPELGETAPRLLAVLCATGLLASSAATTWQQTKRSARRRIARVSDSGQGRR